MKKILLLVLTLIAISSKAQTSIYYPFPDSNATWCCSLAGSSGGCCFCGGPDYQGFATYQLNGQTTLSGIVYNRLLHYDQYNNYCTPYSLIDTTSYFIRQDTLAKKVWIYNAASNSDTILFDFDLHIGDTIDGSKAYWARFQSTSASWIVISIDSVLISGQYRKQFNYELTGNPGCTSHLIEGIGTSHGLFYDPPSCFEYYSVLNKFTQNNLTLYGNPFYPCYNFTLGIDEISNNGSASIFPNLFHTSALFKIEGFDFATTDIKIFDVLGRLKQQQNIFDAQTTFYSRGLSDGLYYYQVTDKKGHFAGGKFIIN